MTVWFHHAIPLDRIVCGEIVADRSRSDPFPFFLRAFEWLAGEVGFWPLFFAVGTPSDVYMTGYQNNWWRREPKLNMVLFSFRNLEGVFTDYSAWHIAMGAAGNDVQRSLTAQEYGWLFKKSWSRSRWLHRARKVKHEVQFVAPSVDLKNACRIWVRNKATKRILENRGFSNVKVKRIPFYN